MLSIPISPSTAREKTPVAAGMASQMGGLWMMGLRMGIGYLVAIGTSALIVDWQYRIHGNKLPHAVGRAERVVDGG